MRVAVTKLISPNSDQDSIMKVRRSTEETGGGELQNQVLKKNVRRSLGCDQKLSSEVTGLVKVELDFEPRTHESLIDSGAYQDEISALGADNVVFLHPQEGSKTRETF